MMTEAFGLFPKSAVMAGGIYLGIAWGLGGTFSDRLANSRHIPACIKGLNAKEARATLSRPGIEREMAQKALQALTKEIPQLRDFPLIGAIDGMLARPKPLPMPSNARARCQCLAFAAKRESQFDYMLWVASIRYYEPQGVSNFQGLMARFDRHGTCGKKGE